MIDYKIIKTISLTEYLINLNNSSNRRDRRRYYMFKKYGFCCLII